MAGVLFFHFGRRSFRTAFGSERRAVDLLPPDPTVACPSRCTVATPHHHARSHLTRGQIGPRLGRPARHCTGCAGAYAGRAAPTRAPPKERWSMDRRYVRADEWGRRVIPGGGAVARLCFLKECAEPSRRAAPSSRFHQPLSRDPPRPLCPRDEHALRSRLLLANHQEEPFPSSGTPRGRPPAAPPKPIRFSKGSFNPAAPRVTALEHQRRKSGDDRRDTDYNAQREAQGTPGRGAGPGPGPPLLLLLVGTVRRLR